MVSSVHVVGLEDAARAIEDALCGGGQNDRGTVFLLLSGPPGSGKTTMALRMLEANRYTVHRCSVAESAMSILDGVMAFCSTQGSVDAMLMGRGAEERKAVFLDNDAPDSKTVRTVYNAMLKRGCRALLVASLHASTKAPDIRRKADHVAHFRYPTPADAVDFILGRNPDAERDAVFRCVMAAECCVPKAIKLLEGEALGTAAEASIRGRDTTIFDEVNTGVSTCLAAAAAPHGGFADTEVAISSEPSLCVLIFRESVSPGAKQLLRRTVWWFSKTPPGDSFAPAFAATAFREMARAAAEALPKRLVFPKCYTTASSRASSLRKLDAQAARAGVPLDCGWVVAAG